MASRRVTGRAYRPVRAALLSCALLAATASAVAQATATPAAPPKPTDTKPAQTPAPAGTAAPTTPRTFKQPIPTAAYEIEMVLVPGDAAKHIKAFWMSTTEVTWDAFDVWVFGLDGTDNDAGTNKSDAVSRPSKPYIPPDRGYGHEGYAAICVSSKSAEEFCKWLSVKSKKTFRLATEDEWENAAHAGTTTTFPWGDDASVGGDFAWSKSNADNMTHPVGTKKPNAFGLFDMLGNAREWVKGRDGEFVLKGGGFRDAPADMPIATRWPFEKAWQVTDPQIPKSVWWLSDGNMIGLRIVCEVGETDTVKDPSEQMTAPIRTPKPTPTPTPDPKGDR